MSLPPRVEVIGTPISAAPTARVVGLMLAPPTQGLAVAVCNVHALMSARRSPELADALKSADIATPDGMPVAWALRGLGVRGQERVHGQRLFTETVEQGLTRRVRHYFYGSTTETLMGLEKHLRADYPEIEIVGSHAPPFRPLSSTERLADLAAIRQSGAQIVWVGLGMPKQELWMAEAHSDLPGVVFAGVGAVFDWVAGNVPKAPQWMQSAGLEWLFRLSREPRRLWRRYAWNNPAYLVLAGSQVLRHRMRKLGR